MNVVKTEGEDGVVNVIDPLAKSENAQITLPLEQADVENLVQDLAGKAPLVHTQAASTITDLTEVVQDFMANFLVQGANVTLSYNDAGDKLTIAATGGGGGGGGLDAEAVRDTIAAALRNGTNINIVTDDAADTITINTTATVNSTDAQLRDRSTHTNTQSADTLTDGTTNKAFLATERTKLAGIATGATVNSTDAQLRDRATHTGTQASTTITDFTEAVQDAVAAFLVQGTNVTLTHNDAANTLTIAASGGGGGTTDPEVVRDTIAAALVQGANITITNNDAGDTITIATTATVNSTDAQLRDRSTHTGTQSADTLTNGTNNKVYTTAEQTKVAGIAPGATVSGTNTGDQALVNPVYSAQPYAATINISHNALQPNKRIGNLTGNTAITINGLVNGSKGEYKFQQDGTGSRTVSINGTSQLINPAINSRTDISWSYDGIALVFASTHAAAGIPGPSAGIEWVNIKTLGVTGNGSDETTAFKAALASTVGKVLVMENITVLLNPNAATSFNRGVVIQGGRRTIKGFNAKLRMVPSNVAWGHAHYPLYLIWATQCPHFEVTGIEIDMENAYGDAFGGTGALTANNCTNVLFERNYVHDNGFAAMSTQDCVNVEMNNNRVINTDACLFVAKGNDGIAGKIRVTNNYTEGGTSESIGIYNASPTSWSQLPMDWVVSGNTVKGKDSFGLGFGAAGRGVVENNFFINNLGGGFFYAPIYTTPDQPPTDGEYWSIDIKVLNNIVENSEWGFNNIGSGFLVQGNTFKNIIRRSLYTNEYGNNITALSNNVKIINNIFENTNSQGFPTAELYRLKNSTFENNQFYGFGNGDGVKLIQCENVLVQNNFGPTVPCTVLTTNNYAIKSKIINNQFIDGVREVNAQFQRVVPASFGTWTVSNNTW